MTVVVMEPEPEPSLQKDLVQGQRHDHEHLSTKYRISLWLLWPRQSHRRQTSIPTLFYVRIAFETLVRWVRFHWSPRFELRTA